MVLLSGKVLIPTMQNEDHPVLTRTMLTTRPLDIVPSCMIRSHFTWSARLFKGYSGCAGQRFLFSWHIGQINPKNIHFHDQKSIFWVKISKKYVVQGWNQKHWCRSRQLKQAFVLNFDKTSPVIQYVFRFKDITSDTICCQIEINQGLNTFSDWNKPVIQYVLKLK